MKKRNKIVLIFVLSIVFIIGLFFSYKAIMLYRYTMEKPDDVKELVNGWKNYKTINISKKELLDSEYIIIGNFKIKNIMDGYTIDETNSNSNIEMYQKEIDAKKYVIEFITDEDSIPIVDAFVENDIIIYGDIDNGFLKGNITDADREGFLEKNNIKNDIDFYHFFAENYYMESNIFTDTKTLKKNYAFNVFSSIAIPKIDHWDILEGDMSGMILYIGTKNDISVCNIMINNNDKQYEILTSDPRFKEESFMIDFISTIEIIDSK